MSIHSSTEDRVGDLALIKATVTYPGKEDPAIHWEVRCEVCSEHLAQLPHEDEARRVLNEPHTCDFGEDD